MCEQDLFIMKPKVDFCFKELLEDEEVRKGFLAAILNIAPEEIIQTKLMQTHLAKKHKEDKQGILDIRVLLNGGEQIDIEMQVTPHDYWTERSLFYLNKMYVDQIHEGEDYGKLQKCIHIGILDFILFEDMEFYSRFHLWEDGRRLLYSDKLEIHVLELPKLNKYQYPETELLRWARFFNAESREELKVAAKGNKYTERAYAQLVELSADEEKRLEYEQRQKAIRDQLHIRNSGFREGRREGFELGVAEGISEGQKRINMLNQKLIADGRNDDLIRSFEDSEFQAKLLKEYGLGE